MKFEQKIKLANDYEEAGKYLHALQLYQSILKSEKHERFALFKMASMYVNLSNIDAAVSLIDKFYTENTPDLEFRVYFAKFLISIEHYQKAVEILDETDDASIELLYTKALALFGVDDLRRVRMLLRELITRSKSPRTFSESYLLLAKCDLREEKFEEAIALLKNSLEYDYDNVEALYLLSSVYYRKGMLYHAGELVELAMEREPENSDVIFLFGRINFKLKNYDEANTIFRKYEKLTGDSVSVEKYLVEIAEIIKSRVKKTEDNSQVKVSKITGPGENNK